jgi:phage tail sheath protein FI
MALAVSTEHLFTNAELDTINTSVDPINAIRQVPGAGIVIMGGRTIDNTPNNRYINLRRSLIYIEKSMNDLTSFALFENNDSRLWSQINATLNSFLFAYWTAGGLRGTNPSQAFYVRCDSTNNSFTEIQAGRVNIEIGVALEYPAEFVVIKIGQLTGNASA